MLRKIFTKKRGRAGFTLIELLVTITIIGIISITTFAIIISSMNTFKRQKDVMDANEVKETVCLVLKEHLRKRGKMILLNENVAPVDLQDAHSRSNPKFSADQKDNRFNSYYVEDIRLQEYHMMYSEGGRIYTVTSNEEGRFYIDKLYDQSVLDISPIDTMNMSYTPPGENALPLELKGKYGRKPLMLDNMYGDYYVDVTFKPIFTEVQGRFRDLQVVVFVYDHPTLWNDEHQVAKSTETFHMLNIENRHTSIEFQNDKSVRIAQPNLREPSYDGRGEKGYKYCYFA